MDLLAENRPSGRLRIKLDDPEVLAADELATILGNMAVSLVLRRLRSIEEVKLYPVGMVKLLTSEADACMKDFHDTIKIYQALDEYSGNKFFDKVRERGPLRNTKTMQYKALAEQGGWKVTAELLDQVRKDWTGLSQTKVVEDGFNVGRMTELNRNNRGEVRSDRCFDALIRSDVLETRHRWKEIEYEGTPLPRAAAQQGREGMYVSRKGSTPKEFAKIVSKNAKAHS